MEAGDSVAEAGGGSASADDDNGSGERGREVELLSAAEASAFEGVVFLDLLGACTSEGTSRLLLGPVAALELMEVEDAVTEKEVCGSVEEVFFDEMDVGEQRKVEDGKRALALVD